MFKIGKTYKINSNKSFYTATIKEVTNTHIWFEDKNGSLICLNLNEVKQATESKQ